MCNVLLLPVVNPIAINKYIYIISYIILYHIASHKYHCRDIDIPCLLGSPSVFEHCDIGFLGKFTQFYYAMLYYVAWHSKFVMK
jgi:hypothetical protein